MNAEIFISAKTTDAHGNPTPDSKLAREVHDYLTSRGYSVFPSTLSLAKLGVDAYKQAIDHALDAASVLIAVGTSAENLESQWVRYEWDSFFNDVLSGIKPEGHIFVYVQGVPITRLPRALRQRQVFSHDPDSLGKLGNFVDNALGGTTSLRKPRVAQSPSKAELIMATKEVEIAVVAAGCKHMGALTSGVASANSSQPIFEYVLLEDELADAVRLMTSRNIDAPGFFNALEEASICRRRAAFYHRCH